MIEGAILHRPVFTLISEHFTTQEGTLHFSYIDGDKGGPVTVARSWDEHLEQLAAAVENPTVDHEHLDAFVRSFVRPRGHRHPRGGRRSRRRRGRRRDERHAAAPAPVLRTMIVALTPLAMGVSWIAETRRPGGSAGSGPGEGTCRGGEGTGRTRQRRSGASGSSASRGSTRRRRQDEREKARDEMRGRELARASKRPAAEEGSTKAAEGEGAKQGKAEARAAKILARETAKAEGKPPADESERKQGKAEARAAKVLARETAKAEGNRQADDPERARIQQEKEQARAAKLLAREAAKAEGKPPADDSERVQARQANCRPAPQRIAPAKSKAAGKPAVEGCDAPELSRRRSRPEPRSSARRRKRAPRKPQPTANSLRGPAEETAARREDGAVGEEEGRARSEAPQDGRADRAPPVEDFKRDLRERLRRPLPLHVQVDDRRVTSRNELPVLLNARGLVGRGAEIGVRDGKYSDRLLETWKGSG